MDILERQINGGVVLVMIWLLQLERVIPLHWLQTQFGLWVNTPKKWIDVCLIKMVLRKSPVTIDHAFGRVNVEFLDRWILVNWFGDLVKSISVLAWIATCKETLIISTEHRKNYNVNKQWFRIYKINSFGFIEVRFTISTRWVASFLQQGRTWILLKKVQT
jgi:hypothetical protein